MNNQQLLASYENKGNNDEIDLIGLLAVIWQRRWLVIGTIIAFLAVAILYLNVATYRHTAELTVMPSQASNAGGISAGGLAGLASLAGVNLSMDGSVTPFEQYLEGIKSGLVAETLSHKTDIMKVVFKEEWDEDKQRFVNKSGTISKTIRGIKQLLGIPVYPWREPDASRLQTYIEENVIITESAKSQFVTISFDHEDPQFARQFLSELHAALDEDLRQKALVRTTQYIAYLTEQLQKVTVAEHREALVQALSEQEKFRMMASSGLAYAADPFGNVTVSREPTSPRPIIVIILSILLGGIVGSLAAIAIAWLRENRQSGTPQP